MLWARAAVANAARLDCCCTETFLTMRSDDEPEETKYAVARTNSDLALRGRHCYRDLRPTVARARLCLGTELRSRYVAKCCPKRTAGMKSVRSAGDV